MAESSIILGGYELLEVIGDGAEGRVYKARCISEGVSGVSKGELVGSAAEKHRQEKESQQFRRQIEILRKLNHRTSSVTRFFRLAGTRIGRRHPMFGHGVCSTVKRLNSLGKNRGTAMGRASVIFSQILEALQYAGRNGVVHRDLKPSNIHVSVRAHPTG